MKLSKLKLKYNCHKLPYKQCDCRQQSSIQKIETDRMHSPRISYGCALQRVYKNTSMLQFVQRYSSIFIYNLHKTHKLSFFQFKLDHVSFEIGYNVHLCLAKTIIMEFRPCDNKTFEYVLVMI